MKTLALVLATTWFSAASLFAGTVRGSVSFSGNLASPEAAQTVVWVSTPQLAPPPAPLTISQKKMQFTPSFAVITTDQQVDFPNNDSSVHQVYSLSPAKKFNLGFYEPGQSKHVLFDAAGTVDVKCYIHPHMKGRLLVVPTTHYGMVTNGKFAIADVPPGKYTVTMWNALAGEQKKEVEVKASGPVTVNFSGTIR